MKRPFVAHIEFDVVVMAETEEEALDLVEEHLHDEVGNQAHEPAEVRPVKGIMDVEPAWHDAIPYGGDDDRTIREIVAGLTGLRADG